MMMYRLMFFLMGMMLLQGSKAQDVSRYLHLADSVYYSNPDSSYSLCCCAEAEARKRRDEGKIAESRLCKARYLLLKTRYQDTRNELSQAIAYFKSAGDKNNLARAYNSKAILLERLGDDEGKYNYQNEAVRLYEETGNIDGQVRMLSNLSLSYTYDKRFKEAESCLDRILMMIEKLKQTDIYFYYQNKGILHMHKNEFEKAVLNLETAVGIARENQMVDSEITALTRLADCNTQMQKYALAQEQLDQARGLAIANNLEFELDEIYTTYIDLYKTQDLYKPAFEMQALQSELRLKTDRSQRIHKMNEDDKKDDINARLRDSLGRLKKESGELRSEMDVLRACKWILLSAALLLLVVITWALVTIKRLRRKMSEQKKVLERVYQN